MTSLTYVANDAPVPESTLNELFFEAIDRFGDDAALQRFGAPKRLVDISYREVLQRVRRASAALGAVGAERGDRVAILSQNCPEWAITDYACLCSGLVVVPIYPTLMAEQVGYVLSNSEAKVVLVSDAEQARKVREAAAKVSRDVVVVSFESAGTENVVDWPDFLAGGDRAGLKDEDVFRADALSVEPGDVATMLYTSGTTGTPKGVMLTHNNIASNVRASTERLPIASSDNTVSFLPLSHILQRMVDYLFFWTGCTIAYPRSLDTLIVDFGTIRPTVVVSVPRIYEKIYNGVMDAEGLKRTLIDWAVDVADQVADLRLANRQPSGVLALKYRIADRLVFSKVKAAVGGRLRFFVSGGGPLAPALNRFFYSIGLTILEGYGLTETSPVTNVNTPDEFRIGTVGKPVPGTENRIGDDGEIFIRGPQVMKGYYRNPEATAQAIDEDGWFATGDIGVIDADGYLAITDRKKDIIVTAGGKNVAPQPIENLVKTHSLVEQAVLVGDRRRYCALLVVPAFGPLEAWARGAGVQWTTRAELVADPAVVAHVETELSGLFAELASYERPKRVGLLEEEFSVENGLLTPTLKVKRREVDERLREVIDGLYAEEAADSTVF